MQLYPPIDKNHKGYYHIPGLLSLPNNNSRGLVLYLILDSFGKIAIPVEEGDLFSSFVDGEGKVRQVVKWIRNRYIPSLYLLQSFYWQWSILIPGDQEGRTGYSHFEKEVAYYLRMD